MEHCVRREYSTFATMPFQHRRFLRRKSSVFLDVACYFYSWPFLAEFVRNPFRSNSFPGAPLRGTTSVPHPGVVFDFLGAVVLVVVSSRRFAANEIEISGTRVSCDARGVEGGGGTGGFRATTT